MDKNTCCLFPKTSIWIPAPSSSGSQPPIILAPRCLSRYPTSTHRYKTKINLFCLFRCFGFNKINRKKRLEPGWLVAAGPASRRGSQADCHELENGWAAEQVLNQDLRDIRCYSSFKTKTKTCIIKYYLRTR